MAAASTQNLRTSATADAEAARLAALRRYDILDTPPDGAFDRITALAADLFSVPIAIVSLVDHDRIWFKSRHGLPPEVEQIGRDPGLCASAVLQIEPWVLATRARTPARSPTRWWPGRSGCASTRARRCAPTTGSASARCA
jgi:hypothetical protein